MSGVHRRTYTIDQPGKTQAWYRALPLRRTAPCRCCLPLSALPPPNSPALNAQLADLAHAHSELMAAVLGAVQPGMATAELADMAREQAKKRAIGLTMRTNMGFPDDISVCLNAQAMNAIPGRTTLIKDGDALKLAVCGTDGAGAFCVQNWSMQAGTILPRRRLLLEHARACIDAAVPLCRPGVTVSALVAQLGKSALDKGIFISPHFAGHMIGAQPNLPPMIVKPKRWFGTDHVLTEGTVLSLFVLAHEGKPTLAERGDGWTMLDRQGGLSAAFSHMVRVASAPQVLTGSYPLYA
ncbi:M24 family metallopeptidase [Massilia genomosp. 1]|nr:M24 family metallopeptidase [Massilia genomosp. 1]